MLLFMDGVGHYDTSGLPLKYSVVNSSFATWSVVAEGRVGNAVKRVATSSGTTSLGYLSVAPLMTRLGTWTPTISGVVGFAVKVDDLDKVASAGIGNNGLIVVMEGGAYHVKVGLNQDGTFTAQRNDITGDVLLAQSTEGLQSGAWAYVECKWVISDTVGSIVVRVNGVTVLSFSGDTRRTDSTFGTGIPVWNAVRVMGIGSTTITPYATARLCDLYLADLASSDADDVSDFLGDGNVQTIVPNGVGNSTGWTASSGANWDTVNDRPAHDADGTYVGATFPTTKDTYQFEDIPPGAEVKAVHLNILARKEDEGAASLAPIVRQSGTDYQGPTQGVASTTYDRYITQPYDLNPATSNKFTSSEINAGEFGVIKVV